MRDTDTGSLAFINRGQEDIAFICHRTDLTTFKANLREQGDDPDAYEVVPMSTAFDADIARAQVVHDGDRQCTDVYLYVGDCDACGVHTFKNGNGLDGDYEDLAVFRYYAHPIRAADSAIANLCKKCVADPNSISKGVVAALRRQESHKEGPST